LKHGGIVWRIAMQFVGSAGVERVILGPAFINGDERCNEVEVYKYSNNGRIMANDHLTEEEIDLICSVYKVLDGKFVIQL
jgi:hypothetical protein